MSYIILISILKVKSSYKQDVEQLLNNSNDVPDTIQWNISKDCCWRIKTFALDHDVHVFKITTTDHITINKAIKNNIDHYGDIISKMHILEFGKKPKITEANNSLIKNGLSGYFENVNDAYLFWNPDGKDYISQSNPSNS